MTAAVFRPAVMGVVKPASVTLEVNAKEAALLYALAGCCNGMYLDEVYVALAGIDSVKAAGSSIIAAVSRALDCGVVDLSYVKDQLNEVLREQA